MKTYTYTGTFELKLKGFLVIGGKLTLNTEKGRARGWGLILGPVMLAWVRGS